MKRKLTRLLGVILFIPPTLFAADYSADKTTLSGTVTDKITGESLPGVTIYITDLKTGAITGSDGKYKIENLPQSKVIVQVSLIGYKTIVDNINLSMTTTKDYILEETVTEMNEVVVTGVSQATERKRTPTPVTTVSKIQLQQVSSTNIIDALATEPGISQVTTGAGISKPVIRGLGYNRVVVVNDGIRQEGQQWGDEHGIEVDEFAVNKVEILKGPASLSYGSDAMAGVISMISAPTLPDGTIQGNALLNYQSNNGLFGESANVAGNRKGFIWDLRYSNKMAHAYKNKYDGYVFNSGMKENSVSALIGFNKSWGYSHLLFSAYNLTPGIVEGDRDSTTGKFVKPVALDDTTEGSEIAGDADFKSYTPVTPYQEIHHYKAVLNNTFLFGNGSLKTTIGFQQNQRQEFGDVLKKDQYGLYFLLNTTSYDVKYFFPEKNNFNISVGVNGMQQSSRNKGTEFLVPEYDLFDIGTFAVVTKSAGKLDISGGLRYDYRTETAKDLFLNAEGNVVLPGNTGAMEKFKAFHSVFTGISGSIGATYQFSDLVYSKLNFSRGYRAPSIGEVGANGVHDGTTRYEIGDPNLKAENSLQVDYALGFNSEHVTAEIDLFNNAIDNFIFPGKVSSVSGGDSLTEGFQTFKFYAAKANLSGGEISIDIHPHPFDWLHFENSFAYVRSVRLNQPDSSKYLPFTPPAKFSSEIKANLKKASKHFGNAFVQFGADYYFLQDKFYAANETETATPAYTLLNFGIGTDFISKEKTIFSLLVSISNVADVAYQSHLSRLKYEAINYATGRTGVFNMGRNISFKLIVPIDIHHSKV